MRMATSRILVFGASRRVRSRAAGLLLALVVAAAILLVVGGCATISGLELNDRVPAGSDYRVGIKFTANISATSSVRGVIAIRIPSSWEVMSVSFTGPALVGSATRSTVMEAVYASEWEATPGLGHNGYKDGYKWWVGYSEAGIWREGDHAEAIVAIDTNGRGGTYLLDFATGLADKDDPEDVTNDKTYWQLGSAGASPSGALLDQPVTLYCFTDATPEIAYYEAIQGLAVKGFVHGYPTGSSGYSQFRPDGAVKRAQFAKMIDGVLGLEVDEEMPAPVNFTDLGADIRPAPGVANSLYPHEYVWVAYQNKVIKGYADGTFKPYADISRGQVVTMMVRALQRLHPGVLHVPDPAFAQSWGNDLPPEHRANARTAEANGLLAGLPLGTTSRSANGSMSRGEVAQVLWNMLALVSS